jgi:hypothetical protein
MGWFDFWKKKEILVREACICGNGKNFDDCHGLEFALPEHEKPDPD